MQILPENNREESESSSQTAAEITILRSKRNGDVMEELERNLETQFQLHTKKKCEDTENDKQKSQYKNSELNSAWEN